MIAKKVKLYTYMQWAFMEEFMRDGNKIPFLIERWGIKYIAGGHFDVVDARKFTIFMLKYSELIEKIVYEKNNGR